MALIKKIRTKDVIGEHLIVDGAGSILPLSRVTAATVTINNASVASAEEVVWLNNIDHKQFVAVSGGQYYKDWTEFTYGGITYPPSSIYADKKAKALFRVGKSLMQFSTTDNAFVYILEDDLAQITEDAHNYTDQKIANLVNGAPDKLNTLDELAAALKDNENIVDTLNEAIGNKVSKVEGKGLSTNDYTTAEKNKVAGIGAGATIEANFNSANVPYNVVLPFSGIITDNITVANTSANNPNGIYWSNSANKFVARAGTTSFTYHSTWASFSDLSNETYPASAYYHRADAKGKLYLKGNVSYAFVAGSLIPVGDGVGGNIDLSNYYTKAQADTNFIKKNGQYVNIGNYVAIGDIEADSEFDAVAIYPGVGIEIGAKYNDNGFEEFSLYKMGYPGIDFALGNNRTKIGRNVIIDDEVHVAYKAIIDNNVHIGPGVEIGTIESESNTFCFKTNTSEGQFHVAIGSGITSIGEEVRIGNKVVIDESVNIGKNIQLLMDGNSFKIVKSASFIGPRVQIGTVDGNVVICDNISIGDDVVIESGFNAKVYDSKIQFGYDPDGDGIFDSGVILGTAMSLYLEQSGSTSYLVIKDAKNNNAIGKIAFVNGDVISTSVVSGDTLAV